MNQRLLLFFLALFVWHGTFSQNEWGLECKIKNGNLAPHRAVMDHLRTERVWTGEVSYFVELNDTNTWANYYPKPRIGLTGFFNQLGNTPILGDAFGIYAFGELPFFRTKKVSFNGRVGTGMAFISKVYDAKTNPKNNAVSSHINATILLGLNFRYFVKKNSFGIGAEMTHFSNGSAKLPNLGLNFPLLSFSYGRVIGQSLSKPVSDPITKKGLPVQLGVNAIFSWKEVLPLTHKKYPVYGLNLFARKIFSPKVGVEFALDGIYKTSILDYLPEFEKKPLDIVQLGAFLGYVLSYDHFSAVIGMGGYYRDRYVPEDYFYHRIGMRYRFKSNLQIGWTLKANWGKADYWEWSVGYLFNRKKK
jgi:hypothetical protein